MSRQRRGEETRLRILQAAEACFAQNGYDATSVAEICKHAGLSKGAFYHHFSSKQALFIELLNRWLENLDMQFESARTEAKDVPEGLFRMAEMTGSIFQEASGQFPILFEFWVQAVRDPQIWKAAIAPYHRYRAFFSQMIEAGISEGSLRPVDPDLTAQVLVSLAVGLLLQGSLDPDGADWAGVVQDGIKMLLRDWER
jgi:AcrR family transcriptional regulator